MGMVNGIECPVPPALEIGETVVSAERGMIGMIYQQVPNSYHLPNRLRLPNPLAATPPDRQLAFPQRDDLAVIHGLLLPLSPHPPPPLK